MAELTPRQRRRLSRKHLLPNLITIAYTLFGFIQGVSGILASSALLNGIGLLLLTHSLVLSGLLIHEVIHRSVFHRARLNDALATLMSLLNGACYVPFEWLKRQHLAHHLHKVGYDGFSISAWTRAQPKFIQYPLLALEFCYIPILSLLSRARLLAYPFIHPKYRKLRPRIISLLFLRASFFALLFSLRPAALALYLAAYLGMITIFRIFDCFHHTFDIVPLGCHPPALPPHYEQDNTYSSLLSRRHAWLNTVFLNYGYHNAHHALFGAPWYQLPRIDRLTHGDSSKHCILSWDILYMYHRHRIRRILEGLGKPERREDRLDTSQFHGIIMNLSFIDYDYNDL